MDNPIKCGGKVFKLFVEGITIFLCWAEEKHFFWKNGKSVEGVKALYKVCSRK